MMLAEVLQNLGWTFVETDCGELVVQGDGRNITLP